MLTIETRVEKTHELWRGIRSKSKIYSALYDVFCQLKCMAFSVS